MGEVPTSKPKTTENKTYYFTNLKLSPRVPAGSARPPNPLKSAALRNKTAGDQSISEISSLFGNPKHNTTTVDNASEGPAEKKEPKPILPKNTTTESRLLAKVFEDESSSSTTTSFGKVIQKANHFLQVTHSLVLE